MENTEIMHKYKCASCLSEFTSEKIVDKCPNCRSKVLIHLEGESKKSKCCSSCGGNCSCCTSSCN